MAANGTSAQQAFAPILAAMQTMQSSADREQKKQAHDFLDKFQKTAEAWQTTFAILQTQAVDVQTKMFAATTLKGKIIYDIHQLPRETLLQLRDTLLTLLKQYQAGPKPIRTQLCLCLANLAIQMLEWKDVLPLILSTLGGDSASIPCVLEFLHVLPEEVTEGRKINLTEDELIHRTKELLEDNAQQVIGLLTQYAHSSDTAAKNPQLLECITSWSREVPLNDIVNSSLLTTIIEALSAPEPFETAVECLCSIFKETRDVDESLSTIQTLYPRIVALRPLLVEAAETDDTEVFNGISRIFAEAAECWVILIARMPQQFRSLVEAVLESGARDREKEAIRYSFEFWYELKQYVTLDKYMQARLEFVDIYSKLVDVLNGHLEYPKPESGNEADLFEGDREQEENFREFRHRMGDVLKTCCDVIGVTECLRKPYDLIEKWVKEHGQQAAAGKVPEWQKLEAPLFSLRAMGARVPPEEDIMLPRLVNLIIQIPDHDKVRFQAVMALGRYTEWTAQHPETLQPQLDFIMAAFNHAQREVIRAAALSFKFFCNDCADLLKDYTPQIQLFYANTLEKLPPASQEEVTDGVASIVAKQPLDNVYGTLKLFCQPVVDSLVKMAHSANDEKTKLLLADKLQLITIFIQWVQPYVSPGEPHPAVEYCKEIFPMLAAVAEGFSSFTPILERVCRCWRYMVLSYRTAMKPLLPDLAHKLAQGFAASKQGCFLWATDSIVREFSEGGTEPVGSEILQAIFTFFEQQALTFLRILDGLPPEELPDIIEDFFRLSVDILLYHPYRAIPSNIMTSILQAACVSLTLLKEEPLMATLHFLRDFLAYGTEDPPGSTFSSDPEVQPLRTNPPEIRERVKALLRLHGEALTQRVLTGMMYTFPRDCFPDASGVILGMFQLCPRETSQWVVNTVNMLPAGSISPQEQERLGRNIEQRIASGEVRKIRTLLQDFTNSYRRRNVAPREGLGRLEAAKFRFAG